MNHEIAKPIFLLVVLIVFALILDVNMAEAAPFVGFGGWSLFGGGDKTTVTKTEVKNEYNTDSSGQAQLDAIGSTAFVIGRETTANVVVNDPDLLDKSIDANQKITQGLLSSVKDIFKIGADTLSKNFLTGQEANSKVFNEALVVVQDKDSLVQAGLQSTAKTTAEFKNNTAIIGILAALTGGYFFFKKG